MADWSHLPQELVTQIAKCLDTRFDILRFRSVCSTWRSSFPLKLYPLPINLPSQTINSDKYSPRDIMIDTLFLVRSPASNACRVVNVREYTKNCARRRRGLLKPLLDYEVTSDSLVNIPKVLDLTKLQVIELGHQFVVLYDGQGYALRGSELIEKAAFLWSNNDFMMLTLVHRRYLYVVTSKSGKTESIILETGTRDVPFRDIISFNGKFYAIDVYGKTTVVDQSLNLSFIQHLGSSTPTSSKYCRKLLVESGDNLLAVEMLAEHTTDGYKVMDFRIFKLNEEEHKWDRMESLGDRILFLGVRHSISASASEFCLGKGNLIFYSGLLCEPSRYGEYEDEDVNVFDLDTYAAGCLEIFPEYCKLFWPPAPMQEEEPYWFNLSDDNRKYRRPSEK